MSDEAEVVEGVEEVVPQGIADVDLGMSDEEFVNTDFDAIQATGARSDEEPVETEVIEPIEEEKLQ